MQIFMAVYGSVISTCSFLHQIWTTHFRRHPARKGRRRGVRVTLRDTDLGFHRSIRIEIEEFDDRF